jgi:hypothetical protein
MQPRARACRIPRIRIFVTHLATRFVCSCFCFIPCLLYVLQSQAKVIRVVFLFGIPLSGSVSIATPRPRCPDASLALGLCLPPVTTHIYYRGILFRPVPHTACTSPPSSSVDGSPWQCRETSPSGGLLLSSSCPLTDFPSSCCSFPCQLPQETSPSPTTAPSGEFHRRRILTRCNILRLVLSASGIGVLMRV